MNQLLLFSSNEAVKVRDISVNSFVQMRARRKSTQSCDRKSVAATQHFTARNRIGYEIIILHIAFPFAVKKVVSLVHGMHVFISHLRSCPSICLTGSSNHSLQKAYY